MLCPSCQSALLTLNKPCYKCGMLFTPDLECPICHKFERDHLRQCPPREKVEQPRVLCPLCGGKRHRHEVEPARHECLWQQCFRDYVVRNGKVPPEIPENLQDFSNWLVGF